MERYKNVDKDILVERAKELECLYLIDEVLENTASPEFWQNIAKIIPVGFRNMASCIVTISFDEVTYESKPYTGAADDIATPITVNGAERGYISAAYPKGTFPDGDQIFLDQERKLIRTIAGRVSERLIREKADENGGSGDKWKTILDLLQKTDNETLLYVCSRMISLISCKKPEILVAVYEEMGWEEQVYRGEINAPLEMLPDIDVVRLSNILFSKASGCLSDERIYENINIWIYQGKTYEIARIVNRRDADIHSIIKALRKYIKNIRNNQGLNSTTDRWLKVELIRRFLTENPDSITNAQKHIRIESFCELLESFIVSSGGIGKIGGKGTGLFIAHEIIKANLESLPELNNVRTPRTWYISSEELNKLIEDNGLDELHEHKYKDIVEIRATYPRIVQKVKNLRLSSHISDALSEILDACADKPLIVRSSSLLEDQVGTAFSGKYKSLFIPNTGTKVQRYKQLSEGILEVLASVYNPDSVQYRKKRNLLDYFEQMGILIQEVVGKRVGPYFFPLYAGLAFSFNELQWSPRIKREDGLLRIVMGLGTRAVDRVGDDFPVLVSPGQPGLRVNQAPEEIRKYSPQMIDVIDLENSCFVTIPIEGLIRKHGADISDIGQIVSVYKDDLITDMNLFTADFEKDDFVVTFEGLFRKTSMLAKIRNILALLQKNLGYPVDIEFAGDGEDLYLLQCRPQSRNSDNSPTAIPPDISRTDIVFTAGKHISNGKVTGIRTVVYVDPVKYSGMEKREDFLRIGSAVSELNRILPRRSFILMGPGRWGSRGDIKLGVPVTYSDINNTAMLIEVASKGSKYQPELSFGTHFFQDLVEENIKYLPLYPDDGDVIFNKAFFNSTRNALGDILKDHADLGNVIKVIQISDEFYGKELAVLMNADVQKAVAFLTHETDGVSGSEHAPDIDHEPENSEESWRWRHYMAEKIAEEIDMEAFGVKGIYLIGSTNSCSAKVSSDIDLLIHLDTPCDRKKELDLWLKGWSSALAEMNYLKTGYKTGGLLDVHYITDKDIEERTSFAVKLGSVYDPAYPLKVR